jgi:para-aminobenzoate synthetase component 1
MLVNKTYTQKMNTLSGKGIPFLFIIDYLGQNPLIYPLDNLPENIHFSTPDFPDKNTRKPLHPLEFEKHPVRLSDYEVKFQKIQQEIIHGNSFLANLTQASRIEMNWSLEDVYFGSSAKYKLLINNKLVVFSPETFIRIKDGKISTFPMKGTIDASMPNARQIILEDEKETAEHYTIVDLMRNDLSRICSGVEVENFRFVDRIFTHGKSMLQVSSKITGTWLEANYQHMGDLLFELLPAGSICGAPKSKTVEILHQIENYDRGYYSGVFGVFDGSSLDSAVMIRFIEQTDNGYIYKSGGGITHRSQLLQEYNELIDKIYVPLA